MHLKKLFSQSDIFLSFFLWSLDEVRAISKTTSSVVKEVRLFSTWKDSLGPANVPWNEFCDSALITSSSSVLDYASL